MRGVSAQGGCTEVAGEERSGWLSVSWIPTDPAVLSSLTCNREEHSVRQLFTINLGMFLSDKTKEKENRKITTSI